MLGSGDKDIQQGNGKMHNTAFTWQGVSHALLHQKSFITQLQVAGSVPREWLGTWSLRAQQTPASLSSQAAAGASSPSTKQSTPKSNKAPELVSGSIKLSCMAKTASL